MDFIEKEKSVVERSEKRIAARWWRVSLTVIYEWTNDVASPGYFNIKGAIINA